VQEVFIHQAAAQKVALFFPWVYDNEILRMPGDLIPGDIVKVLSPSGGFLGIGYLNPVSTIALRILSFAQRPINQEFLREKISQARLRRAPLMNHTNAVRAVHSEADDLPGLIIDDYNGYLSIQINTAGMERLRSEILATLSDVFHPRGIYELSDAGSRGKEGLPTAEGILWGDVPHDFVIDENAVRFKIRLQGSQKTGFYLDQRRNRQIVASYVGKGFRVLDLFSHMGGFGIYAALKGAADVTLVDQSRAALALAEENITLNGLTQVATVKRDAFEYLADACRKKERFDLIILDPPSFTKTRGAKGGALKGYRRLVSGGLHLLKPDGYLALFSCSHHIALSDLEAACLQAGEGADCRLHFCEYLLQDQDHPYHLNIPQSLYLKGLLLRKVPP